MGCGASKDQPHDPNNTNGTTAAAKPSDGPQTKWDIIDQRIPWQPTDTMLGARQNLWTAFDVANRNSLTKDECYSGCVQLLQLDQLFPTELRIASDAAWESTHLLREKPDATVNVDPQEWRLYLRFLRDNLQLAALFLEGEKGQTSAVATNGTITKDEFMKVLPRLAAWGVEVDAPEPLFAELDIDKVANDTITFYIFSDWAVKSRLDRENMIAAQQFQQQMEQQQQQQPQQQGEEGAATAEQPASQPDGGVAEQEQGAPVPAPAAQEESVPPTVEAQQNEQPITATAADASAAPLSAAPAPTAASISAEERSNALAALKAILPTDNSADSRRKRDALFTQFDSKNANALSLAECLAGATSILGLDKITTQPAAVNKLAFVAANRYSLRGAGAGAVGPAKIASAEVLANDPVERAEFRLYLTYLVSFFELHEMFDTVDTSDDNKISKSEFLAAVPQLNRWGAGIKEGTEEATFVAIDTNKEGTLSFSEFVNWATRIRLTIEREDNATEAAIHKAAAISDEAKSASVSQAPARAALWEDLKTRLPRKKTKAENEQRDALFKEFDTANAGSLSFDNITVGCRDILKLQNFAPELTGTLVWRAFGYAANARTNMTAATKTNYVDVSQPIERAEFRLFLVYVYNYLELFVALEALGVCPDEVIRYSTFAGQIVPHLEALGIEVSPSPQAVFEQELDRFGHGFSSYETFSQWAIEKWIVVQNAKADEKKAKKKSKKEGGGDEGEEGGDAE